MCGRYTLTATPEEVARLFEIAEAFEPFPPRYNIAPTQPIAVVQLLSGRRRLELVRWGLVPHWVKDPSALSPMHNARSETAAEKPAFRTALRHRRCLVPASGFYEWRRTGTKAPFHIRPRDGGLLAFAGLCEEWIDGDGGIHESAAILTTAANATLATIHDRMPVIVPPADFGRWLDVMGNDVRHVADLLGPAPDDLLEAWPVGPAVNSARNDGEELVRPADAPPAPKRSRKSGEPEQGDLLAGL